jgi:hypothetical protein
MRLTLTVASTIVDQRTRASFSPACVADLVVQLNTREYPVSYEYRSASLCGKSIPGTARLDGTDVLVDVEVAAAWWTIDELERVVTDGIGGGVAGRSLSESAVGTIHTTEKIRLTELTLLQLHSSANPRRPATKAAT